MKKIKVLPSLLSCNFANISKEVKGLEDADADGIHIDVMDGHFVPNLSMGPKIVKAVNKSTDLFLDVHLMTYNPYSFVERFIEAGADMITFHIEATEDVLDIIKFVKKCNKLVSIAINPETSVSMLYKYIPLCDQILFMTVHPGFGGQKFIEKVLDKIKELNSFLDQNKLSIDIQVDGGINLETAKLCIDNNVNSLVSGQFLFSSSSMKETISKLKNFGKKI